MTTERELAEKQAKLAGRTGDKIDITDVRPLIDVPATLDVTPPLNVTPTLDVPRVLDAIDRNIRSLYEREISASETEKPGNVAVAENHAAPQAVAYFAARCLGRIVGVPDPENVMGPAYAKEARRLVTTLL